jgi:hypothetical protein
MHPHQRLGRGRNTAGNLPDMRKEIRNFRVLIANQGPGIAPFIASRQEICAMHKN